jgi:DivIVA domain-containing protein
VLTVLAILGVLVVLFGAAVLATRDGEVLRCAPPDAADLGLPTGRLQADDVRRVRFGLAFRGYRMSEVDQLLDRLASQLTEAPSGSAEAPRLVTPSEPPLASPPVHPRAAEVPPVQVAQAPVEIAPLPAGEPSERPRD